VTGAGGCGEIRHALGVYVLGAIGPADRAAVDSHLARCADCREELAGLAGLPGLLGSVPAADVTRMGLDEADPAGRGEGPPDVMLRSLLERAARLRRHLMWRRVAVAAAVAVIAGGGAVAGSRMLYPPAVRPAASALQWAATVHGSNTRTGAGATVRYLPQPWGLELLVQVSGITPGTRCELQVLGPGGRKVAAGGWTVAGGHAGAWYPASSPLPVSGVRGFVVTTVGGLGPGERACPVTARAGRDVRERQVDADGQDRRRCGGNARADDPGRKLHQEPPGGHSRAGRAPGRPAGNYRKPRRRHEGARLRLPGDSRPASHRLETEVDGFTHHERDNLAAAEADLRAEAATEHRFDLLLSKIPFPPQIAATARALIRANQRRAALAGRQARSSSVTGLLSFASRHRAADAAVEAQVRIIRRALGLPTPQAS